MPLRFYTGIPSGFLPEFTIVRALEGSKAKYDEVCYLAEAVYDGVTEYPRAIEIVAYGVRNGVVESTPFIAITILNQK